MWCLILGKLSEATIGHHCPASHQPCGAALRPTAVTWKMIRPLLAVDNSCVNSLTFNFFRDTDSKNLFFFLTGETIFGSLFIPHLTNIKEIAGNCAKEIIISMSRAKE